jgi:hypothetical protein
MMDRPWPGPAVYDAAPANTARSVHNIDWTILDRTPISERFPNAADLAQLHLVIQQAKRRGER